MKNATHICKNLERFFLLVFRVGYI